MSTTMKTPRRFHMAPVIPDDDQWIPVAPHHDGARSIWNAIAALRAVPDDRDLLEGWDASRLSSDPELDSDIADEISRFWDC